MRAEFREYYSSFFVEVTPETTEEVLRAARLGILARKGAKTFITFGEQNARISFRFEKNKRAYPSIEK